MTDMPYSTVSKETMWLLLWSMHQGRGQKVTPSNTPTEEECRRLVAGKYLMMRYSTFCKKKNEIIQISKL